MKNIFILLAFSLSISANASKWGLPPSPNCCAGHGGICGCYKASGYYKCCDGAASPMCKCVNKEDEPPPPPPPPPKPEDLPSATPWPTPKKKFLGIF